MEETAGELFIRVGKTWWKIVLFEEPRREKMHSVIDALLFLPMCILSPIFLKNELIRLTPLIRFSLELKAKAPSSRYRILRKQIPSSPCDLISDLTGFQN